MGQVEPEYVSIRKQSCSYPKAIYILIRESETLAIQMRPSRGWGMGRAGKGAGVPVPLN